MLCKKLVLNSNRVIVCKNSKKLRKFAFKLSLMKHLNREVLRLAIPSILANITIPLVGMVDVAIVGHIADATAIGGIAIGTMLFDLLYWNFGFLRVGTSGLTAQAFGRQDEPEQVRIFSQNLLISLSSTLFIWLIQWLFLTFALYCIPCSAEVADFARKYFYIRIWAAPATLSLMVFKGWFIGMQNTLAPMVCDIVVNVVNMAASYLLAVRTPLGMMGVAYGTIIAQFVGLLTACLFLWFQYGSLFRRKLRSIKILENLGRVFQFAGNLFVRSLGFMIIYVGFTSIASRYGDQQLAVSAIMMKLFMLFSYFVDGFAYAGEALSGRFIGEQNILGLKQSVRILMAWSIGVGLVFTALYALAGEWSIRLMTSDLTVILASHPFLPWLVAMPIVSCLAFMWDGVFIGAAAGVEVRNCMLYAALGFVISYLVFYKICGIQALYLAYFVHLLVRAVYLSAIWPRTRANVLPSI